jgi:phosphatidylglycerophosphatase GEP4
MSPHVHVANISGEFAWMMRLSLSTSFCSRPRDALVMIVEVNYTALKEFCNIRAIVFDKDNTLTAPYALEIHPKASRGLDAAVAVFGRDQVAILSNSAGTKDDPGYKDATEIEKALGIPVIRHNEKKPGGLAEVLSHFHLDDPSQICMVGDRLLTDVVFGNLHGMLTVHTLPVCKGSDNAADNKIASSIRSAENVALYGDWFWGRLIRGKTLPHKYWPGEEVCPLILPSVET